MLQQNQPENCITLAKELFKTEELKKCRGWFPRTTEMTSRSFPVHPRAGTQATPASLLVGRAKRRRLAVPACTRGGRIGLDLAFSPDLLCAAPPSLAPAAARRRWSRAPSAASAVAAAESNKQERRTWEGEASRHPRAASSSIKKTRASRASVGHGSTARAIWEVP